MKPSKKIQDEASDGGEAAGRQLPGPGEVPTPFYEEVLMNIPADIAVFNTNGEYLFINSGIIKDAATREWLIGKTVEDYCRLQQKPPEMAARRQLMIDEAVQTKQLQKWEERFEFPGGQVK